MSDIFNRLPFEILCAIFILVGQPACLESMRVCHKWFDQVPRHSTSIWKQVDFYFVWTRNNPCLIQCLGPHVRDVNVAYDRLDLLMTILKKRQCMISSLTVQPGDTIPNATDLISGLQKASEHLTRLVLQDLSNDISPLSIARTSPRLTALSISLDKSTLRKHQHERRIQRLQRIFQESINTTINDTHGTSPEAATVTSPKSANNNDVEKDEKDDKPAANIKKDECQPFLSDLIQLELDTGYDFETHIEPLLQHCPSLRSLELSAFVDLRVYCISIPADQSDFDFCRILDLCPCIESLGYNAIFRLDSNNSNSTRKRVVSSSCTSGENDNKGLREFKFASDRSNQSNSVMAVLEKASSTLQVLSLRRIPYNESGGWFDLRKTKKLQRLSKLTVASRAINNDVLTDFLCNYANTLEELHLTSSEISESVLEVVSKMVCLKQLSVSAESNEPYPRVIPRRHHERLQQQQQQRSLAQNEQQPVVQQQQQNRLHSRVSRRLLHRTRTFIEFPVPPLPKNFHLLTQLPALQEIDLGGMRLSDSAIRILGSITSLQSLWLVDSGKDSETITRDGLLAFASSISSSNNVLRHLALGYFPSMDDTVMAALGEIRSLQSLCITSCVGVTDTGLEKFLDTVAASSNYFSSISIYHCKNITKDGVQYAYNKLGRANVIYWNYNL